MRFPYTLQQLQILKAIAAEKNFTKAAKILHISQPFLSYQIKLLEKNLQTKLLNRKKNTIFLTESGQIFLQYSERILALCEESCRTLIDLKNGNRGNLILGTSQIIGTYLMPKLINLFIIDYPRITLNIQLNSKQDIIKKLLNNNIDIAIISGTLSFHLKKDFKIQPFIFDELNLILANSHPFAKKKIINKDDLYLLNFISLDESYIKQKSINRILVKHKINPNKFKQILKLNSIENIKIAVSLGLGVAFISSSSIQEELKLNSLKIIQIKNIRIIQKVFIVSNLNCYKSKSFEFFWDKLKNLKKNHLNSLILTD